MAGTERYVRNSTADFLVFTKDSETDGIEVRVQDHEVWLTQKGIGQLFDVDRSVVAKHLRNIFAENELSESTTCAKFAQVVDNGKTYHYKYYSLPAIIAVGYRTNSTRATQFRQWATKVLDTLPGRDMFWIRIGLLMGKSLMKITSNIWFPKYRKSAPASAAFTRKLRIFMLLP